MIRRPPRSTLFPYTRSSDLNVGVADELLTNIRKKAIGSEVMLQLSPDQQVVKVVRDELAALLGKHAKPLFAAKPPSVDRKSTRLNSSHGYISYAVFCLKKKKPGDHPLWRCLIRRTHKRHRRSPRA